MTLLLLISGGAPQWIWRFVMTRKIVALAFSGVLILATGTAFAEKPMAGDNELSARFSYSDVDYGSGSTTDTELTATWGRYVTANHQFGLSVSYVEQEIDDDFFGGESTDGNELGVFYAYNFSTTGTMTPFVGIGASIIGGDLGDIYDSSYGLEAGLKVFPYKHAGFVFSVAYAELQAAESFIDDADGLSVGAGLLIRF